MFPFDPPETKGFLMLSGGSKGNIGEKRLNVGTIELIKDKPLPSQCFPLIPLKTSENKRFSDIFRGIKREHWEEKC